MVALVAVLAAAPSDAQTAPADEPRGIAVLTRAVLRLGAERLASGDPRFVWDTNFGGEIDLVDYVVGRATFLANYEAILGEELRPFDPNQGNYILAGSASGRLRAVEIALVFYHESRHLSDREKVQPIDWNMLGGRVQTTAVRGATRLDLRADLRGVVQKSSVDYEWELDAVSHVARALHSRVVAIGAGGVRVLGVDSTLNRGTQVGYRAEGGVRFRGRGAAAELFVAVERRIDPFPLEFGTVTWATAGFRLTN